MSPLWREFRGPRPRRTRCGVASVKQVSPPGLSRYAAAMLGKQVASVVAVVVGITGCNGAQPGADVPTAATATVDTAAPGPSSVKTAATSTAAPGPAAPAEPQLPESFGAIGGACSEAPDAESPRYEFVVWCGQDDLVAAIRQDLYRWPAPPSSALLLEEKQLQARPLNMRKIYLDGHHIWARVDTCGNCRRMMGWCLIGDLRLMTKQQLLQLQKDLGLPDSVPPLREPAEWRTQYGK